MSTSSPRENDVPQARAHPPGLVLLYVLSIPVAFIAGTLTLEPLAAAGLAAGAFSLIVGLFIVAPTAGRLAKERFLVSLASPDETDEVVMFHAVRQIVRKMAALAANPKTRAEFAPLFEAYTQALDASYQGIVNNIQSQAARGVGEFDPSMLSEESIAQEFEGMVVEKIGGIVDPFLGSVGATERGKQIVHAKILMALRGGNGGQAPEAPRTCSPPDTRGGVDFRRG